MFINKAFLKTFKSPPPIFPVKFLKCPEQILQRTTGESCSDQVQLMY